MKVFYILWIIPFIECSLNDYKRCQRKFNCTRELKPSDCPSGQFLDVKNTNNCCHGCRKGIGKLQFQLFFKNVEKISLKNKKYMFLKVVEKVDVVERKNVYQA